MLRVNVLQRSSEPEPVVITGIGMITSVGTDRESSWQAVCRGESGVRRLAGLPQVPDWLGIAAIVDCVPQIPKQLKVIRLNHVAAEEAIADAALDLRELDGHRVACAISGHMGDYRWLRQHHGFERPDRPGEVSSWDQFLPNSACWDVATRFGLLGPRICHSTACASGLIDIMGAVRVLRENQCDVALAGSAEAIDPLFAAGFQQMRVLAQADDPREACRPFDRARRGFVMGEGAAHVRAGTTGPRAGTRGTDLCRDCRRADAGRCPPRDRIGHGKRSLDAVDRRCPADISPRGDGCRLRQCARDRDAAKRCHGDARNPPRPGEPRRPDLCQFAQVHAGTPGECVR